MEEYFIEPEWLEVARSGAFYYPASGTDIDTPLRVFADHIDEMHFCDIRYLDLEELKPAWDARPVEITYVGPRQARIERQFRRHLEPGKRIEIYGRSGKPNLKIIRRRGFAQMGLQEFRADSISVFMHRNDGVGEGGSNLWFLHDKRKGYHPLSNLFSALQIRLKYKALVLTDGSNSYKSFLRSLDLKYGMSGEEIYKARKGAEFLHGSFKWECVGWINRQWRPTLMWGLTRR